MYDFTLGIFYLGLARLYERTRDDTIAQVIEASYFAMLLRVSSLHYFRIVIIMIFAIYLYRKWVVDIHSL